MSNYRVIILSELLINLPLISSLASHTNSHRTTGGSAYITISNVYNRISYSHNSNKRVMTRQYVLAVVKPVSALLLRVH